MKKAFEITCFVSIIAIIMMGCQTYYKANSITPSNVTYAAQTIDSVSHDNRYYILRNGNDAYHMRNMVMDKERNYMSTQLEPVEIDHRLHLVMDTKDNKRYKKNDAMQRGVTSEVHFFIPYDSAAKAGSYTLQLDNLRKIEVLEHDKKKTTTSYVLGALGIGAGAFALTMALVALLKTSCPFVAAYDGQDFTLQGEIYGGAIYPQLERKDYLPLKMKPLADGSLQVKITNELKERQYTNYVRLWKISHPEASKIYVDENGELVSVSSPESPMSATLGNNRNVLPALVQKEDDAVLYLDDTTAKEAVNEIHLVFNKPASAKNGKLVVSLKNSYFLDKLYGEVAKNLGSYYPTYTASQKKKPAAELLKWIKAENIPLTVSIKTEKGWQEVKSITTVGPVAFRETAFDIDLSQIGGDVAEIKLSCGFMFWELDYAAMDFSAERHYTIEKMLPVFAEDESDNNVLPQLLQADKTYLDQPVVGNAATIHFKPATTPKAGYKESYVLETQGYYEHIRDFSGKPNYKLLAQFKKPGNLKKYGLTMYNKANRDMLSTLAKQN